MTGTPLDRRTVLRGMAAATAAGLAGCGVLGPGGPENTTLSPPGNYEALQRVDPDYPIYGEPLPDVSVEAPLRGRSVSTREFVGDRHVLVTFAYTRCGSICPALTSNLVQVQADAEAESYSDDVALLVVTFDPAYDSAERFEQFCRDRGADVDAENWFALRPDSEARVQEIVVEAFGHPFQANPGEGMPWIHNPLLVFANDRGYVERSYTNEVPDPATVIDDVRAVVE